MHHVDSRCGPAWVIATWRAGDPPGPIPPPALRPPTRTSSARGDPFDEGDERRFERFVEPLGVVLEGWWRIASGTRAP